VGDGAIVSQRLVIVAPTTVEFDSRTRRIAAGVAARGHEVTVLARWAPGLPREEVLPAGERIVRAPVAAADGLPLPAALLGRLRPAGPASAAAANPRRPGAGPRPGRFRRSIAEARRIATAILLVRAQARATRRTAPAADIYHGMAFMGIPVALDLARRAGAHAVYDARDIYLDSTNLSRLPGPVRSLLSRRERGWARHADRVITVNDGCADLLAARFGVARPLVVLNASPRREAPVGPGRRFHDLLDLAPETRIVLYQGGFMPDRGLDVLFRVIRLVPQAHLVLLGFGPLRDELVARAAEPASGGRVHVLPAVPPEELADWVVSADVGVMPNQPRTLNERLSTPNKLFESLAVGLPVVSSDFPERRRIVIDDPDGPLGAVCDPTDPVALAAAIRSILDLDPAARADLRARCLRAAHERWNWETQLERLLGEYTRITAHPW